MHKSSKPSKCLATNIRRARFIQKTLGTRVAAGYLRNRGWSIESTLYILMGK